MKTVTFPTCTVEMDTRQHVIEQSITIVEASTMVDGMRDGWFGQVLAIGNSVVNGKSFESYEDIAKAVAKEIEGLKTDVYLELDSRRKLLEAAVASPTKADKLSTFDKNKAKMDNTFKSAKSVITGAIKLSDIILRTVTDGGHVLWRKDGAARGKTELQDLIKSAKSAAREPLTEYEKAMRHAVTFARSLAVLPQADRKEILDNHFFPRLDEYVADEEGEYDDSNDDDAPVAKAA